MNNRIRCSGLNKRITIEIAKYTTNQVGGATKTWEWYCTLYGMVSECKQNKAITATSQQKNSYTVVLRYAKTSRATLYSNPSPELKNIKLKYNKKNLTPDSIILDKSKKYIIIEATEA